MGIQDNATNAAMAWASATKDAGNFIDSLMMEYGWTMPGPDGTYSTIAAADAFDPNNVMQFSETGQAIYDPSRVKTSGGQIGGKGIFSDILRGGGTQEAEIVQDVRGRGIMQGGLAKQARQLAEDLATQKTGQALLLERLVILKFLPLLFICLILL